MSCNKLKNRINDVVNASIYSENPDFPKKSMLIEITNLCNDACIFCFNKNMVREKGFIDSNLVDKVLKEAYELGMREVGFYTTGEPLLNKNLEDYIYKAKTIGYQYVYITTNGVLANISRMKSLIENGLDSIKFSINAINSDEYRFIHGKSDFEKVITNLKELYNYKLKNSISINIFVSYIKTKYTDKSIDEIKEFFNNICDEVTIMNVENQGGLQTEINDLLLSESDVELDTTKKMPCSYPFKSVIVTREGYLTACCLDFQNYLAYADLNKASLKESWNNEVIRKLRREQLQLNPSNTICSNCVYNSNIQPTPLVKEFSSEFEYSNSFNRECLIKRINDFLNTKNNK